MERRKNTGKTDQKPQPKPKEKAENTMTTNPSKGRAILLIILAVIAVSTLLTAYIYENSNPGSNVPLSTFLSNLRAAPTIGIYVNDLNGTVYPDANFCATSLIYQIISQNYTHRDPATIDFFIINGSARTCTYTKGLRTAGNLTNTTLSDCISMSSTMPSIFINYSRVNRTIVKNSALYIEGTPQYLYECGISAQIR